MTEDLSFSISHTRNGRSLHLPFRRLKKAVLGKRHHISLVLTNDILSKKLNRLYRKKNNPTNVLSFPYSKKEGEIFLNLSAAEREAKRFKVNFRNYCALLYIHSLLHLKGLKHGSTMKRETIKIQGQFGL